MSKSDSKTGKSIAAKKAAVVEQNKPTNRNIVIIAAALMVIVLVLGIYTMGGNQPEQVAVANPPAQVAADTVAYPVAEFADGKARYYEHQTDRGITVRYFILKSSDGIIRAAFDACDVCWPAGKGYQQEGDVMICRNCGRRFVSVKINEVKGGCNPAPLERRVEGDWLLIKIADIETGKGYFDFKKASQG